jgi:predicted ATP-grasp superfamily ATP-dependent carboligase
MHVLIVGASTRAAAESAALAGFEVTAIDGYGDLDQHPSVRALSMPRDFGRPFSPRAAARAAGSVTCDAVVYLSSFENDPRAVARLASGRALWGNRPSVLRAARDPRALSECLRRHGLRTPRVYMNDPNPPNYPNPPNPPNPPNYPNCPNLPNDFLVKPLRSGGGLGVRRWRQGDPVPQGCYLQERVEGTPGSVVFAAAAGRAVVIGVTRQLVGEPAFGAEGHRYCGSVLTTGEARSPSARRLAECAADLACVVSERFDLVGVNGIDFIDEAGVPVAVEINPRWCASMELVERAFGLSVFRAHAAACETSTLPSPNDLSVRTGRAVIAKAVVFAKRDVVVGDTRRWIGDTSVRDVPGPAEEIAAGRPICTVFADGPDEPVCMAALVERAERVYAQTG